MKPTATFFGLFLAVATMPAMAYAGPGRSSAASTAHSGSSQGSNQGNSSGSSAAKANTHDITITKHIDKSSPKLFENTTTGSKTTTTTAK